MPLRRLRLWGGVMTRVRLVAEKVRWLPGWWVEFGIKANHTKMGFRSGDFCKEKGRYVIHRVASTQFIVTFLFWQLGVHIYHEGPGK